MRSTSRHQTRREPREPRGWDGGGHLAAVRHQARAAHRRRQHAGVGRVGDLEGARGLGGSVYGSTSRFVTIRAVQRAFATEASGEPFRNLSLLQLQGVRNYTLQCCYAYNPVIILYVILIDDLMHIARTVLHDRHETTLSRSATSNPCWEPGEAMSWTLDPIGVMSGRVSELSSAAASSSGAGRMEDLADKVVLREVAGQLSRERVVAGGCELRAFACVWVMEAVGAE